MGIKTTFSQINIIFLALAGGQIMFAAVVLWINNQPTQREAVDTGLGLALPIVMLSAIGIAYWIYQQRAVQGAKLQAVSDKMAHYRISNIIRLALVEGPNLLAMVLVLIEGHMSYLIYFAGGMLAFLFFRPTVDKFINDYQLSASEQAELRSALS